MLQLVPAYSLLNPDSHLSGASMAFTLLLIEPSYGRSRSIGKILLGPGIGTLDHPCASKIAKLPCPIQDLPGLLRGERPYDIDERLLTRIENHISILRQVVRPL